MLGFWKLRHKITSLDYKSWSRTILVLQLFERYAKEAKKHRDFVALEEARDIWDTWFQAVEAGLASRAKSFAESTSRRPNNSYLYSTDTLGEIPKPALPTDKTPSGLQAINLTRTRAALRSLERIFS